MVQKTKLKNAILDELINGINELLKTKHRCSLSRNEVLFLEKSITLLKEYKKSDKDVDADFQIITIQVVEILIRFFLFSSENENIENIF